MILRNPELLLLDEATAALDEKSEEFLLDNIWKEGYRTISVAHRLKSALMGDTVAYIENCAIAEIGSPQELKKDPTSKFSNLLKLES